jgi:hemerythrin-like domain-containing protein
MKRSDFLHSLSRDHHQGLSAALRLKRATSASADEARQRFLDFWQAEGRGHFQVEEEVLLPAYARHGAVDDPAVVRVLTEHVELRRRALELEMDERADLDQLHELGQRLERHIRHEERVLFPKIEVAMPEDELSDLAEAIERAERRG